MLRLDGSDSQGPGYVARALNFGIAVIKHLADGSVVLTEEAFMERLIACNGCEHKSITGTEECLICGCPVYKKAKWRSEDCPIGKWPKIPTDEEIEDMRSKAADVSVELSSGVQPTVVASMPLVVPEAPQRPSGGCGCGQ